MTTLSALVDLRKALETALKGEHATSERLMDILKAIKAFPVTAGLIKDSKLGKTLQTVRTKYSAAPHAMSDVCDLSRDIMVAWKQKVEEHMQQEKKGEPGLAAAPPAPSSSSTASASASASTSASVIASASSSAAAPSNGGAASSVPVAAASSSSSSNRSSSSSSSISNSSSRSSSSSGNGHPTGTAAVAVAAAFPASYTDGRQKVNDRTQAESSPRHDAFLPS